MVELIRGWVRKISPAQVLVHQKIPFKLGNQIENYLENKKCETYPAPFDVRLKGKKAETDTLVTVVQPDISVICDLSKLDDRGCLGAPDWVIEILSPGNSKREMQEKYSLYEENGVREYWVIAPEYLQVMVFLLKEDRFVLGGNYNKGDMIPVAIFDGFFINSEKIFD